MTSYILSFLSAALIAPPMIASAVRAKLLYPERAQWVSTIGYLLTVFLVFSEDLGVIGSAILLALPLYMMASYFIRIDGGRLAPKTFVSLGVVILSFTITLLSFFYYLGIDDQFSTGWLTLVFVSCVMLFLSLACSVFPGTPFLLYAHNILSLVVMVIWAMLALHRDAIATALLFTGISLMTIIKIWFDVKFTIEKS